MSNEINSFVTKERYNGRWRNTYFDNEDSAKRLCFKILKKGGIAVWMKNAR